MKISEVRDMTTPQINGAIDEAREEMLNLRIQFELGSIDNFARFKELKRDLARMFTVRRERELAAELVGDSTPATQQ